MMNLTFPALLLLHAAWLSTVVAGSDGLVTSVRDLCCGWATRDLGRIELGSDYRNSDVSEWSWNRGSELPLIFLLQRA